MFVCVTRASGSTSSAQLPRQGLESHTSLVQRVEQDAAEHEHANERGVGCPHGAQNHRWDKHIHFFETHAVPGSNA